MPAENRVSFNVSLPPAKGDRFKRECEERDLGSSKLFERAVDLLFAEFDARAAIEARIDGERDKTPKPSTP